MRAYLLITLAMASVASGCSSNTQDVPQQTTEAQPATTTTTTGSAYEPKTRTLGTAAFRGLVDDLQYYVKATPESVNELNKLGFAPLHLACMKGHVEAVSLLLDAGAEIDVRQKAVQMTPLHYAAGSNHMAVVELLIAQGADRAAQDKSGRTPAAFAEEKGATEALQLLRSGS